MMELCRFTVLSSDGKLGMGLGTRLVLWVQHGHLCKENFLEARDVWATWN